ncbi:MAG: 7-carboxy-7-deazaguanine synthase [Thiocapsa sp.]|jgi:7-carboxy-7-deazaguanine synthase (Cx14CxxC type)|nr:7-carboxy-7-deazaguanine synthase [Thiocapsa sp.]MCG6985197.1 7-carboxy-7-deazaguanine synthase [Thiocapsa sp.]
MSYSVKEVYYTLQGEGAQAGRAAVFCRFAGCNLWSGREQDRASAICRFCDTDFRGTDGAGGGVYKDPEALARRIESIWSGGDRPRGRPLVVLTGGEPLLQLDRPLIESLHERGFEVAIETNGTRPVPDGVDWICVSPKAGADLVQRTGQELKLVFPQPGLSPEDLEQLAFEHFFLQPMDGPDRLANTHRTIAYCRARPHWRLSIQTHKLLGIP